MHISKTMTIDFDEDHLPILFASKKVSHNWNDIDLQADIDHKEFLAKHSSVFSESHYMHALDELHEEEMPKIYILSPQENDIVCEEPEENELLDEEKSLLPINYVDCGAESDGKLCISSITNRSSFSQIQDSREYSPSQSQFLSNDFDNQQLDDLMIESKDLEELKEDNDPSTTKGTKRKDVVIKSTLRSMRKYYSELLEVTSEHKRKIRNIRLKHQKLVSKAISVAQTLNFRQFDNSLGFYLAAIAFPSDFRKILKNGIEDNPKHYKVFSDGLKILNKVEEALIRYSKRILKAFVKIQLFIIYLGGHIKFALILSLYFFVSSIFRC